MSAMHGTWWCMAEMSLARPRPTGTLSATLATLPMAILMTSAMTLPGALPAVHHVALNSLRARRSRAVAEFLAVYLGSWLAFVTVVVFALHELGPANSTVVLLWAFSAAALWELTSQKRRALDRCHRSRPLPPRGLKATLGVLRFATLNASGCIGTCAPAMVAMLAAESHRLTWMVALTALALYQKMSRTPRRATRHAAVAYAATVLGVAIGSVVV